MTLTDAPQAVIPVVFDRDDGVRAAFTSRWAGNVSLAVGGGDVAAARAVMAGAVGADPQQSVFMEQVHGRGVARVGRADRGRGATRLGDAVRGVDGLVTSDLDVALVALVADCVPVLLCDSGAGVAAVHAGRRGVVAGVVGATVSALLSGDDTASREPSGLAAAIGPSIGGCCYEVPDEVAHEVTAAVPAAKATTTWGTASLDLRAAVEEQLRDTGVTDITRYGSCTRCDAQRWFSHRATAHGAPPGRQAGVIVRSYATWTPRPYDR